MQTFRAEERLRQADQERRALAQQVERKGWRPSRIDRAARRLGALARAGGGRPGPGEAGRGA